jgi:hypothetical protein
MDATNLIESGENVIGELDFRDGGMTHSSKTNTKTCNALLCEWGIEDAFFA